MGAREKIAYLKGLIDGQNLADTPDKEKFYAALVDALDSLAAAIEEHENVHGELDDYLEQLDEDVSDLEDRLDELDGDESGGTGDDDEADGEDGHFDEEEYESVTCPHCGNDFYYEPALYGGDEDLVCPHCGKPFKRPGEEE